MENSSGIPEGLGLTALVVAAFRAIETEGADPLFHDYFASRFVRAADTSAPLPVSLDEIGQPEKRALLKFAADRAALRTRYIDDYLASADAAQAVILAAGLDARAFRLDWPPGCTVFELDQRPVLEFKQRVLDQVHARARCDRRAVAADLREDWETALAGTGFDPALPTAWLAEGLLPYLPPAAEENLLNLVHKLSAAGSSIAVWAAAQDTGDADKPLGAMYASFGVDIGDVVNTEPRRNAGERLSSLGWTVTEGSVSELAKRYDRLLPASRHRISLFTARY